MLQISLQHRILLAVEPVDFRREIDGLKALCQQKLFNDSFSGINRMYPSVKLLVYDASGSGYAKNGLAGNL
jgi:transposase